MSSGEVIWRGHGSLPGDDGWVSLHLADTAHLTLVPPELADLSDAEDAVLEALAGGGAWFFRPLADRVRSLAAARGADLGDSDLLDAVWSLLWAGRVTNDTIAPLRALLSGGRTAHRRASTAPRSARYGGRRTSLGRFGSLQGSLARSQGGSLPGMTPERIAAAEESATAKALRARSLESAPPTGVGRWTLLPSAEIDPTVRAVTSAELLLDRYGVLTRGSVVAEDVPGGFAAIYRVLAAAEEAGKVRRGYFVESLGASQFASTGAVDRLRSFSRLPEASGANGPATRKKSQGPSALVLAASDPANPYGAALHWPERARQGPDEATRGRKGHQPGRKAGALVVLVDGELVLYVERGGKTMLCWSGDLEVLQAAADALALAVREGALGRLTVEKADGASVLGSEHPLVQALSQAGFHMTPRGLRLRR
jgi:ATP-dependent Lhr-like helicase